MRMCPQEDAETARAGPRRRPCGFGPLLFTAVPSFRKARFAFRPRTRPAILGRYPGWRRTRTPQGHRLAATSCRPSVRDRRRGGSGWFALWRPRMRGQVRYSRTRRPAPARPRCRRPERLRRGGHGKARQGFCGEEGWIEISTRCPRGEARIAGESREKSLVYPRGSPIG